MSGQDGSGVGVRSGGRSSLLPRRPIVDARQPASTPRGHIPGAHNLPCSATMTGRRSHALQARVRPQAPPPPPVLKKKAGTWPGWVRACRPGRKPRALQAGARGRGRNGRCVCALHCWRGGLRFSEASPGWPRPSTLGSAPGRGTRCNRHWCGPIRASPGPCGLLGGRTGTARPTWLRGGWSAAASAWWIRAWLHHRGSSFGRLGLPPQPKHRTLRNIALAPSSLPRAAGPICLRPRVFRWSLQDSPRPSAAYAGSTALEPRAPSTSACGARGGVRQARTAPPLAEAKRRRIARRLGPGAGPVALEADCGGGLGRRLPPKMPWTITTVVRSRKPPNTGLCWRFRWI